jgi:hypothetical protein
MPCCDTGRNIQKYKGAAASTLQDVTDNGNTTTGDIITTSGYFIGDGSKLTNVPGVSGAAFTLQQTTNKGNVTTDTVEFQNSITSLTASGNVLVTGNVTASVFYGDGGLLSNTATTPTLQTVTTIGNTTTNTIDFQNSVTSLTTSGNVLVTGNVTASKFYGDGLGLTSLNASSVSTGTLLVARGGTGTTTSTGSGSVVLNTNPTFSGTVQGGTFSGSGSGLTSLNAGNISTGTLPVARGGTGATTLNNLIQMGTHTTGNYVGTVTGGDGIASTGATSGEGITHTLSVDRKANGGLVIENNQLAVNLGASAITGTLAVSDGGTGTTTSTGSGSVVLNTNPTLSGTVTAGTFSGSGSGLTSLNATNISTGTLPVARGGTGATTLNNLIQMGTHTTGNYVATITGGNGISSTGATSGESITHTLSVDTKANGGLVMENNQLAVNLGASAITGTLAVSDGGTGTTTSTGSGSVVLNTNPTFSGTVTAGTFSGSGSGLTSLNATNISTGTLPVARGGTGATTLNNLIQMGTHTTGNYVATITGGNGISSTGATSGESITHTLSVDTKANGGLVMENNQLAVNLGASAITGTLAVSDGGTGTTTSTGSGSVVLNTNPTFSGTVTAGTFSGSGSGLTSLNATNISTGTLPVARGGTGLTSFVSGDLIYANGTSSFTNLASNSSTQGYFLKNDNGVPIWADVSEVGSASPYSHVAGTGLSGGNFNGSDRVTWTVDFGVVATTSNLNSNVTRIGNLETNLTNNSNRITTITNDLTNNVNRIGNLETNLTNNSSRITTVTNDLTNNVNRIGNLETNLTNNSSRITTVTNDLTNNVNRIGNLETNLTNNSSRITTVTNDLTNNSSRITTVTNDLTNNVSRISTLENETQPVNRGGTELTSYAIGDILYASGTTTLSKLGIGLSGQVLTVYEGTVSWKPGTGNISLNQAVNVSNSTSNVVQFTGADYDTSFVTSKKVGIANTAPTHTLDVGSNVSIIDDGIDKLVIRGNCYVINDIISLGTIHTDILKAKDAFIKNTTVVAERPTRQVRLN